MRPTGSWEVYPHVFHERSGMKGETTVSNEPLGDVSFDRGGPALRLHIWRAGILSAEEHLLVQYHCLEGNVDVAAGVLVRNTK